MFSHTQPSNILTTRFHSEPSGGSFPQPEKSRIWLLEDDEVQSLLMETYFNSHNVPCRTFPTGEALMAALELIEADESEAKHIFLLDVTIPQGKGGLDICQDIRARFPEASMILISGLSDNSAIRSMKMSQLRIGFIAKPFSLHDLTLRILGE